MKHYVGRVIIMKKLLGMAIICIIVTSMVTACSEHTPKPNDDENNDARQENNNKNEETTAKPDEEIVFPDERLQKMDAGKNITALQTALNEIGYDIPITNTYDEDTTWAITDFQLQNSLQVTGIYDTETREASNPFLTKEKEIEAGKGLPKEEEVQKNEAGNPITGNPYDILALVNKHHALPDDYLPDDLVVPDVRFPFTEDLPKKQLRKVASDALEELFTAGDKAGVDLFAQSGYRSYDRQDAIFAANVEKDGEEAANNYSARPGESEHQTGLTMDITSAEINNQLSIEFADTKEGKWVKEHAAEYGFIIRYPEEKEDITEYQYEPWHLRYVGVKAAKEITKKGLSLEEYLEN